MVVVNGWQRALIYGLLAVGLTVSQFGPVPSTWPGEAVFATLVFAFVGAVATEWLIWIVEVRR